MVGQGYVGLPLAIAIAEANFICYGLEKSNIVIDQKSKSKSELLKKFNSIQEASSSKNTFSLQILM